MVAILNRIQWSAIGVTLVTVFLIFLWIRGERYKKLLVNFMVLTVVAWGSYFYQKTKAISAAESFFRPIELASYYGKGDCVLEIEKNFSYSITQNSEQIKKGKWDIYEDETKILLLDDQIFGLNELKLK